MELQAEKVLKKLNKRLPLPLELQPEMPGCFRLASREKGLVFQFNYLPRAAADERPPFEWRGQQEAFSREGRSLVHIWEDQWLLQPESVISRMAARLGACKGIHGRETVLERVDAGAALQFLKENHLLVPLKGKYRFGLFYKGELLSLAVFSGARQMKAKGDGYRSFELLRFCHLRMHLVQGGLSKLLAGFRRAFRPSDIMTYVDLDWSEGNAFRRMGFIPAGKRDPQEFWVHPRERIRYYPRRLPFPLEQASPRQLHEANYFRIYNCGSLKLIRQYEEARPPAE